MKAENVDRIRDLTGIRFPYLQLFICSGGSSLGSAIANFCLHVLHYFYHCLYQIPISLRQPRSAQGDKHWYSALFKSHNADLNSRTWGQVFHYDGTYYKDKSLILYFDEDV